MIRRRRRKRRRRRLHAEHTVHSTVTGKNAVNTEAGFVADRSL
jgi:hypothetical protein